MAELQLQEKTGPVFTAENMKQIINDAAAEAAGVPGAKGIQGAGVAGINVAKKKVEVRRQRKFLEDPRVPTVVREYMETRMGQGVTFGQAYKEVQEHILGDKNPIEDQPVTAEDLTAAAKIEDERSKTYIERTFKLLDTYDEYDAEQIANRAETLIDKGVTPKEAFDRAEEEHVRMNRKQLELEVESDLQLETLIDYEESEANAVVYRATKLIEDGETPTEAYARARKEFEEGASFFGPVQQQKDVDLTELVTAETEASIQQDTGAVAADLSVPYETTEDLMNVDVEANPYVQIENIRRELNLAETKQGRLSAYQKLEVLKQTVPQIANEIDSILENVAPAEKNQAKNMATKEIKRVQTEQNKKLAVPDPSDRAPSLLSPAIVNRLSEVFSVGADRINPDSPISLLENLIKNTRDNYNTPANKSQRLKLLTHLALISRSPELKNTSMLANARDALRTYEYGVMQIEGTRGQGGEDNRIRVKDKQKLKAKAEEVAIAKQRAKKLTPYTKNDIASDPDVTVGNIKERTEGVILQNIQAGPQKLPQVARRRKIREREVVGPPRLPKVSRKPKKPTPRLQADVFEPTIIVPPSDFVGPPQQGSLRNLTNLLALTDEDKQSIDKDAIAINEALSAIQLSPEDARNLATAMGDYYKKTKGREYNIGTLLRDVNELTGEKFVYLIQMLQTSDIARVFRKLTRGILGPDDPDHFKVLQNTMDAIGGERNQYIENSKPLIDMWRAFNNKYKRGAAVLAELMSSVTRSGIDPSKRKTVDAAIRQDAKLKELREKKKEEGANKAKINKQIEKRKSEIRKTYAKWDELGKIDNGTGRRIFTQARDKYREYFDEYERLLIKTIQESGIAEADTIAQVKAIQEQFQQARENVPVYFPLNRFGEFYIRVSKSGDANMDGFYMFENAREARQALEEIKKNIADADVALDDVVINEGNTKTRPPREELGDSSTLLKTIFQAIDGKSNEAGVNVDALKDQITQMYLATLPGQSLRTTFINRKGTGGESQDVLRSYASTVSSVATQLPRLKYGDAARRELSALKDQVAEFPNRAKLDLLIGEVETRVNMELSPPIPSFWDTLATFGNKATFVWLMSAAKSGLLQTTQFPLVVGPVLLQEFRADVGKAKVIAKFMQYLNVFNKMGVANSIKTWTKPTIMNSSYINKHKNKKLLERAWNSADKLGKFNTTYAADIGDLSNAPSEKSRFRKGTAATYNFMTGFFHHAERITRELTYMSGFELAYEQAQKKGLKGEKAFNYATQKALDVMNEGLFDYTQYNKPSALRKSAGIKSALQFFSFSNMMASLMVRNFTNMVAPMSPTDRRDAAVVFFGVNLQAALFSGIGGFWGASIIWSGAQMAFDMYASLVQKLETDEDETDEERKDRYAREYAIGNPAYYVSAKDWLEKWWIPTKFGVNGTIPTYLGIENTNYAKYMQLIAEKGIISTALGIDMSNSLALDGLIIRDRPRNPEANAFENFIDQASNFGIFPVLSVLKDAGRGVADILKGDYAKGVERIVPANIKGAVRAYRRGTEGLVTYDGTKLSQIDYSGFELFTMTLLGGRNLEEARITDQAYSINKFYSDVRKARTEYTTNARDAWEKWTAGDLDADQLRRKLEDVDEWNKKYPMLDPDVFTPIKIENIQEAATKAATRRKLTEAYYGVRRPEDAAQNFRLLYLLEKYIGIVPEQGAIDHTQDILDDHYDKNIAPNLQK